MLMQAVGQQAIGAAVQFAGDVGVHFLAGGTSELPWMHGAPEGGESSACVQAKKKAKPAAEWIAAWRAKQR